MLENWGTLRIHSYLKNLIEKKNNSTETSDGHFLFLFLTNQCITRKICIVHSAGGWFLLQLRFITIALVVDLYWMKFSSTAAMWEIVKAYIFFKAT